MRTENNYPYDIKEERGCFGCSYILFVMFLFIIAFCMYHEKGKTLDPPSINASK